MNKKFKRIVLDAQGVTFNAPLHNFFKLIEAQYNFNKNEISDKWFNHYRKMTWLGNITDQDLAYQLTQGRCTTLDFYETLESMYTKGPIEDYLDNLKEIAPLWILSNHRSHWLRNRLNHFNLSHHFEKIIVSDHIGYLKPHSRCFEIISDGIENTNEILYIDDQIKNIIPAKNLNFTAIHIHKIESFLN